MYLFGIEKNVLVFALGIQNKFKYIETLKSSLKRMFIDCIYNHNTMILEDVKAILGQSSGLYLCTFRQTLLIPFYSLVSQRFILELSLSML